ncbi:hypothetical protein F383_32271 [Gossypium arboreum]|uniref:SWIM-type domain-containing protein n=1 Tax=Gossypium arboreum TaxID=29729 RepID=A0A0B0PMB7_GOSAR|nr:hypothetical protein F383_32271 [Gossypium arboreum]
MVLHVITIQCQCPRHGLACNHISVILMSRICSFNIHSNSMTNKHL